jgi:hypothetical protein
MLCGWITALKGKPHGWDRHETRPADDGRMKALRACETLRRHQNPVVGNRWEKWLTVVRKTPKGKKPHGRQLPLRRIRKEAPQATAPEWSNSVEG